jgi:hypothetical protein
MTSGKRISQAPATTRPPRRAPSARWPAIARPGERARGRGQPQRHVAVGERALGDAGELLQQARETLVAAGNASYSDAERVSLAEASQLGPAQPAAGAGQPGDGAGGFLFGGQGAGRPPFVDAAGGVQYRGMRRATLHRTGHRPAAARWTARPFWLATQRQRRVPDPRQPTPDRHAGWIDVTGSVSDHRRADRLHLHARVQRCRGRHHLRGAARTACHGVTACPTWRDAPSRWTA